MTSPYSLLKQQGKVVEWQMGWLRQREQSYEKKAVLGEKGSTIQSEKGKGRGLAKWVERVRELPRGSA